MAARRRRAGAWVRSAGGSGGGNSRLEGMERSRCLTAAVFCFGHSDLHGRGARETAARRGGGAGPGGPPGLGRPPNPRRAGFGLPWPRAKVEGQHSPVTLSTERSKVPGFTFQRRGAGGVRRGSPKPHGPRSPRLDRLRARPAPARGASHGLTKTKHSLIVCWSEFRERRRRRRRRRSSSSHHNTAHGLLRVPTSPSFGLRRKSLRIGVTKQITQQLQAGQSSKNFFGRRRRRGILGG